MLATRLAPRLPSRSTTLCPTLTPGPTSCEWSPWTGSRPGSATTANVPCFDFAACWTCVPSRCAPNAPSSSPRKARAGLHHSPLPRRQPHRGGWCCRSLAVSPLRQPSGPSGSQQPAAAPPQDPARVPQRGGALPWQQPPRKPRCRRDVESAPSAIAHPRLDGQLHRLGASSTN